jgi:GNAT superfamily N-acetyltransferase
MRATGAVQYIVPLRDDHDDDRIALLVAMGMNAEDPAASIERASSVPAEYRAQADLRMWVCEEGGEVTAMIGVQALGDDLIVRDLAAMPEARGRGVGRALLDFIRKELHPTMINGHTWSGAVEFYERCGFTVRQDGVLGDGRPRFAFEWRR